MGNAVIVHRNCCRIAFLRSMLSPCAHLPVSHLRQRWSCDKTACLPGKRRLVQGSRPPRVPIGCSLAARPDLPLSLAYLKWLLAAPGRRPCFCALTPEPISLDQQSPSHLQRGQVHPLTRLQANRLRPVRRICFCAQRQRFGHKRPGVPVHPTVFHPPGRIALCAAAGHGIRGSPLLARLSAVKPNTCSDSVHGERRTHRNPRPS